MSAFATEVSIDRRFARSARLDADLNGTPPLVGYVLQGSIAKALRALADSQIDSKQGAFTWTGPYGGGKSSAALLLANLVAGPPARRKIARQIVGKPLCVALAKAFPRKNGPWRVVAVTGSRMRLRSAIAHAASVALGWSPEELSVRTNSDEQLIDALVRADTGRSSGTLVIVDELGKLLEHEAHEGGDVHLLQDIAEHAARSDGRLVVIGILHQSFEQYAARAAHQPRQEWKKVRGRYQDIAFLAGADETVALLGQAIVSNPPESAWVAAKQVAAAVAKRRPTDIDGLSQALVRTWPLNPVTALLLGPVSRARFAQNERSVFGFLNSAEPAGFRQFLEATAIGEGTYGPADLWDYLATNFGMALASEADGSRFSLAFEAIERAAAKGGELHAALTKSAAAIELFRNGSGLAVSDDALVAAVPGADKVALVDAISDLLDWAILIPQPRVGGYALFAGTDFDLEEAIGRAMAPIENRQLEGIPQRVGFGFAAAKRHYFLTGALRTFEIGLQVVCREDKAETLTSALFARPQRGSGLILLLIGDGAIRQSDVEFLAQATARQLGPRGRAVAVGGATASALLRSTAIELMAVERVVSDHPQLEGDRIARREIAARQSYCIDQLHRSLEAALESAYWYLAPSPNSPMQEPLAVIASALADVSYPKAPILKSELLQRDKPSSNSMAALRELAHAMVERFDQPFLGMTGYPAELGLYLTVLKPFGLHREIETGRFDFTAPNKSKEGQSLRAAWSLIDIADGETLDVIFAQWAAPPYGIKAGVMPIFALAYILAARETVAVYVDGVYLSAIDTVFADKLLQTPADIRLRRIDRTVRETAFLSNLACCLGLEHHGASLPVAAALFQRFEALPDYAKRTNRVEGDMGTIRSIVLKADDPEALLFDTLPDALGDRLTADYVCEALAVCEATYPQLLNELRMSLASALGVDPENFGGIAERAASIKGLTNDYAFDAFTDRVAALEDGSGDVESLISLLLHRPARGWSDRDREQALTETARYGRRFRELEALAAVRDRRVHTEALALVVGLDPNMPPLLRSFALTKKEKEAAADLADRVLEVMSDEGGAGRLRFAALARVVAALAAETPDEVEVA